MAEEEVKGNAEESPQMPEVKPEESQADPAAELRSMLEAHNITSPDDLGGLINELQTYKKGYGDSRNEVGELRKRLEEFENQQYRSQRRYRQPSPYEDEYGENQNQGVDLEATISSVVRKELGSFVGNMQKQQQEAAEAYYRQRAELENRPNWNKVQPIFDKALQTPAVYQALQSGRMTLDGLYSRLNERYLLSQVDSLIKSIPGDVKFSQQSGDVPTQENIPNAPTEADQKKEKVRKAVDNKDPDAVLDSLLPDGDDIFRV